MFLGNGVIIKLRIIVFLGLSIVIRILYVFNKKWLNLCIIVDIWKVF